MIIDNGMIINNGNGMIIDYGSWTPIPYHQCFFFYHGIVHVFPLVRWYNGCISYDDIPWVEMMNKNGDTMGISWVNNGDSTLFNHRKIHSCIPIGEYKWWWYGVWTWWCIAWVRKDVFTQKCDTIGISLMEIETSDHGSCLFSNNGMMWG